MRKSELKLAVKKALRHYYKTGLTNTAYNVYKEIIQDIDKAYACKHKERKAKK